MGKSGFRHGMVPEHIKKIRRLKKENELLKKLLAEKEIESHLKDELLEFFSLLKYPRLKLALFIYSSKSAL